MLSCTVKNLAPTTQFRADVIILFKMKNETEEKGLIDKMLALTRQLHLHVLTTAVENTMVALIHSSNLKTKNIVSKNQDTDL